MGTHASRTNRDVIRYMTEMKLGAHTYVALLGRKTFYFPKLIAAIGNGLSWKAFERFRAATGLTLGQVAEMAGLPRRTVARRKKEGGLRLMNPIVS